MLLPEIEKCPHCGATGQFALTVATNAVCTAGGDWEVEREGATPEEGALVQCLSRGEEFSIDGLDATVKSIDVTDLLGDVPMHSVLISGAGTGHTLIIASLPVIPCVSALTVIRQADTHAWVERLTQSWERLHAEHGGGDHAEREGD